MSNYTVPSTSHMINGKWVPISNGQPRGETLTAWESSDCSSGIDLAAPPEREKSVTTSYNTLYRILLPGLGIREHELDVVISTLSDDVREKLALLIRGGSVRVLGRHHTVHPLNPKWFVSAFRKYTDAGVLGMERAGKEIVESLVGPEHEHYTHVHPRCSKSA
jgi:hypothetical protein